MGHTERKRKMTALQVETSAIAATIAVAPDHPSIQPATLRTAVQQVAALRRELANTSALLKERFQVFERDNAELIAQKEAQTKMVADAEALLRGVAVQRYRATQDKHPAPGVDVKISQVATYDREKALTWAKATGVGLKLDDETIDALVRKSPGTVPGATLTDEPKAQLARDLEKALAVADASAPVAG